MLPLALALALLSQTDVRLRTLDGQSVTGQLVRLSDSEVVVRSGGKEQSFAATRLDSLGFNEQAASSRWKVQVQLLDGSLLNGSSYFVTGSRAKVTLLDDTIQELPLKSIQSVRLRDQQGELARQWSEYLAEDASTDRLIVRRKGEGVESLDVMEGVLKDITETTVNFEIQGDLLKVKRERVDGIAYFRGREPAPPAAACVLVDIDDSRWSARSLDLADHAIQVTTSSGAQVAVPLERIRKLDYAAGNRRYLAELPRESVVRETWLTDAKDSVKTFGLLVGRTPEGPLSIGGEPSPRGLWLPAKSSLIVRVPPGFSKLEMQVGIDDRVASTDGTRLKIEADGKTLADELVKRDVQPLPLKVDLQSARRVRITVDYGGESFLGDQLVLSEAMFVK